MTRNELTDQGRPPFDQSSGVMFFSATRFCRPDYFS